MEQDAKTEVGLLYLLPLPVQKWQGCDKVVESL